MVQVADDISREVGKRADAVRRIRNAIIDSFGESETTPRQKCCKDNLNYTVDPRFPGEVTVTKIDKNYRLCSLLLESITTM